jgi:hypothetical protein
VDSLSVAKERASSSSHCDSSRAPVNRGLQAELGRPDLGAMIEVWNVFCWKTGGFEELLAAFGDIAASEIGVNIDGHGLWCAVRTREEASVRCGASLSNMSLR